MPAKAKERILQGTLRNGKMLLVGTDMVGEMGLIKGNSVSIVLNCSNEKDARSSYKKLLAGGSQVEPLWMNHYGMLVGGLTDKYGYHWILRCAV